MNLKFNKFGIRAYGQGQHTSRRLSQSHGTYFSLQDETFVHQLWLMFQVEKDIYTLYQTRKPSFLKFEGEVGNIIPNSLILVEELQWVIWLH